MLLAVLAAIAGLSAAGSEVPLVSAASNNDKAAVRALVRQKADVNAADLEGMTALHWAAHWNDLDTVKLLLGAGAKAVAANRYGVTALHEAATVSTPELIEALLRAGADANAFFGEGETPLMTAARTGNVQSVRLLLAAGANVNAAEAFRGQTPLMFAAVENHVDAARALLEGGADANARTTTIKFAPLVGGAGGVIMDRPQGGLTALMLAARQGATETAQLLLDHNADVNATEPQYGFTAMQTAVFNGHYRLAAMLVGRGADLNDGSLYVAVEMRNLAHYTNRPNPAASDSGVTHLDLIKTLLAKGADPNRAYTKRIPPRQAQGSITVPGGATPLYRAVRSIDIPSMQALLDTGADADMKINDGSTPLMAAAGLGAPRGNDEEVSESGDRADPVDAVRLLLDKGADINAVNEIGNSALHYAVQRQAAPIIEALAARGAKFDVKNKQGRTPAELARGRTVQLVTMLTGTAPTP